MLSEELKNQRWCDLSRLILEYDVQTVLEIGTFLGESAIFFATQPRVSRVWCIDPFYVPASDPWAKELAARLVPNPYYDLCYENLKKAGVEQRVTLLRGFSRDMVDKLFCIPGAQVDMVYVDGNHSYEGCQSDIALYWPKAKKVIAGDDYHTDENGVPYFPGVRKAVAEALPNHKSNGLLWWQVL